MQYCVVMGLPTPRQSQSFEYPEKANPFEDILGKGYNAGYALSPFPTIFFCNFSITKLII